MINVITHWVLPLIAVLGAAVVLHEFGHFLVAKLFKIRVETFSVGFGPRLIGRKWCTTDYRISAIPTRTDGGNEIGELDFQPDSGALPVIVESVTPNMPAQEVGLRPGDQIVAVDGQLAHSRTQVTQYIQDHRETAIRLTVVRGDARLELTAKPKPDETNVPRLGLRFALEPLERAGPLRAASFAVGQNVEIMRLTAD